MARSTFKVLFYVNGSKEKDGIVPIMGRVTINGTVAQFSCKQTIPKTLWDAKGNRAKGKSAEARNVNLALTTSRRKSSQPLSSHSQTDEHVHAGDFYTRLHQRGLRLILQLNRGLKKRHHLVELHVAERRGHACAL